MPIVRSNPYILVRRSVLLDPSLSFSAKGLYSYLQCFDGENQNVIGMDEEIKELLEAGLIEEVTHE